jgi:WD40 repeat protein
MVAGSAFSVCYEMVLDCLGTLSIKWSHNGAFIVISSESKIVVLTRRNHDDSVSLGSSGFSVAKVIRGIGNICSISIDPASQFIAVCGSSPKILDATANFAKVCDINSLKNYSLPLPSSSNFSSVLEMGSSSRSLSLAASWSPDGNWLALVGRNQNLAFFDTSSDSPSKWRRLFEVKTSQAGLALAWGPPTETGLQYCAYAGEDRRVCILEIRDTERSWEMVLEIPRNGVVYDLDWDSDGLLAAAISDGTVTIMDLSYLRCGLAVNEMDYNWQRQALTCFTEIQRNKGKNCMQTLRWVPKASGSDSLLAIGGTDGEVEILDLTAERHI